VLEHVLLLQKSELLVVLKDWIEQACGPVKRSCPWVWNTSKIKRNFFNLAAQISECTSKQLRLWFQRYCFPFWLSYCVLNAWSCGDFYYKR
jgi:hypothetical protein